MGETIDLKIGMMNASTSIEFIPLREKHGSPLPAVLKAISEHKELDVLLAPEWMFFPPDRMYTQQEFKAIKEDIEQASLAAPDMLIIPGTIMWADEKKNLRNTALIISDGKTMMEYSKMDIEWEDDIILKGDAELYERCCNIPATEYPHVPGETRAMFMWQGRAVGIEICRDHLNSVLKRGGLDGLDMQIVISSGLGSGLNRAAMVVRNNGLAMLCEGGGEFCYKDIARVNYEGSETKLTPLNDPRSHTQQAHVVLQRGFGLNVYTVPYHRRNEEMARLS